MRYSEEELNAVVQAFQDGQSKISTGISPIKSQETFLTGNTTAHALIDAVCQNLRAYAEALNKNIADMYDMGGNYAAFDREQGRKNLNG